MAKHVAHHKHVAVLIVHADAVHPQELGQQSVAMALHNVLVVVGEVAMHVSDVLTGYFFDDQSPIIGDKEATITAFTFTWGTSGKGHQVILVINAKSITEVPEDLGTILLELEMTGQIFPVEKVIVHLDLGAGLKVIWQQHHRGRHLAELIDLRYPQERRCTGLFGFPWISGPHPLQEFPASKVHHHCPEDQSSAATSSVKGNPHLHQTASLQPTTGTQLRPKPE